MCLKKEIIVFLQDMNELVKILNDTLKDKNGKYSRRSLTMFSSHVLGCLLGTFIVLSDLFLTKEINAYAWLVVGALFANGTGAALIISKDKKFENISTEQEIQHQE